MKESNWYDDPQECPILLVASAASGGQINSNCLKAECAWFGAGECKILRAANHLNSYFTFCLYADEIDETLSEIGLNHFNREESRPLLTVLDKDQGERR